MSEARNMCRRKRTASIEITRVQSRRCPISFHAAETKEQSVQTKENMFTRIHKRVPGIRFQSLPEVSCAIFYFADDTEDRFHASSDGSVYYRVSR